MIYALQRAKEQMREQIERYEIEVDPEKHIVGWGGAVSVLGPYTPASKCRSVITHYIKLAKSEEQRKLNENQASLFDA